MLTDQEIFSKVYKHLLYQNKRAMKEEDLCAYRSADGLMCAIGCLIPDEAYTPRLEGLSLLHSEVRVALKKGGVDANVHEDLLCSLQEIHDTTDVCEWRETLVDTALRYGLAIPGDC